MGVYHEMEYDGHTLFTGMVEELDASFDHEFGTKKHSQFVISDFHVIVYINDIAYDVTKALTDAEITNFKIQFIDWAIEMSEAG